MSIITLSHGAGGAEMAGLIKALGPFFRGRWKHCRDDSATLRIGHGEIVFTTDSYVVSPVFFPGGDIGKLAVCGTINDLAVMGARPLGLSLAAVIEEGFPVSDLHCIVESAKRVSQDALVPIVTGDTKVMERGKLDRIIINTAGIGLMEGKRKRAVVSGQAVIVSGGIGEHAAALLSSRFDYETDIVSDCAPLHRVISKVRGKITFARDITRGGLAGVLNEISETYGVAVRVVKSQIPVRRGVASIARMLGLSAYELACEGRFVCTADKKNARAVLSALKKFSPDASVVGTVTEGRGVTLQTALGTSIMRMPCGRIVPRIC